MRYIVSTIDGGEHRVDADGYRYAPDGAAHFYRSVVFDNIWGFTRTEKYLTRAFRQWTEIRLGHD